MSDITHSFRDIASQGWESRYARMIPGTPGIPAAAPATAARKWAGPAAEEFPAIGETLPPQGSRRRNWMRFLVPQLQTANPIAIYQLTLADLLVLVSSCLLSSLIVQAWSLPQLATPVYGVLVILFAYSEGLYKNVGGPAAQEFPVLARSGFFAMALVLVAAWNDMQPLAAVTTLGISLPTLMLWREVRRKGWKKHFGENDRRKVLIVGAGQIARAIERGLREDPLRLSTVVGFLDDRLPLSPQVLGRIGDLDWLARSQFVDEVILAVPNEPALVREAADVAFRNHLDIKAVPDLPPGLWPEAELERIGGVPVIVLHHECLPGAMLVLKRLLDIVGSFCGLVLLAPLMGIVGLLVRVDSPGPVFYTAERTGAKGRPFRCFKFRSMAVDADERKESLREQNQREGPIFKLKDDPRTTHFGRFLRRYSLDELPQLWNVLRGEMSLVGPRPHPVEEVNHYELHHYRRLDMKPGITGLWQITARNSPSFDLNMHLDLTYIENWTLVLDLRILMSTVRVLFAPEGA